MSKKRFGRTSAKFDLEQRAEEKRRVVYLHYRARRKLDGRVRPGVSVENQK